MGQTRRPYIRVVHAGCHASLPGEAGVKLVDPGQDHQQMKDARNEVKSYVRKYRAKAERKLIQARDDMFKTKDERWFNIYQKRKLNAESL